MDNHEEEIIHRSAETKDRNKRRWLRLIGLVFIISLLGGGAAALATYLTLQKAAEDGTVLAQQIQKECEKPGTTDPDLLQFCPKADEVVEAAPEAVKSDPVPGPPGDQGEQGETGSVGPPPSAASVYSAVRRFCTDTKRCDGRDGSDVTPAQVAIAVSSYCNSRGQCKGPAGDPGEPGEAGKDGADAPPVTQAQLIQAVDAYCSENNRCQGPPGSDGKDGNAGPQGPAGVVQVADNCEPAPPGQALDDVEMAYDPATQTVLIDCTYKDIGTPVVP